MQPIVRLCLVLHNHQPVGNFDGVFEAAYQDSYLPFLDVFEPYQDLKISLHTSGPLAAWLLERHPEYVARISNLVNEGRIEIVGGAFYEPILAMIPSRDRRGQITRYSEWLSENFGGKIAGMWMPERVWESQFTADLASSDIQYTVLDDFHFRRAGVRQEDLTGYFVAEDEGQVLRVFPGSEKLRYLIPFQEPGETINYCRSIAESKPGSVLVFGDDGEKFGTWPDTKQHVYENGWLRRFFDALVENKEWLVTSTLANAVENSASRGKVFLPDASYREMTEWAMPVGHQLEYDHLVHEFEQDERWHRIKPYLAGGFWRNFKTRYPESNEMYSRMMFVSRKLEEARQTNNVDERLLSKVCDHLYQGQCNCSYWHGAFGGIYLPHLRNAVYEQLIQADNILAEVEHGNGPWVDCASEDFNFDGSAEVRLTNDQLAAWISPHQGGYLYELDLRRNCHNLLATIQRRPEAYHDKVRKGGDTNGDDTASIHDRVVCKQEGLDERLFYDRHPRKSMIDHFWSNDASLAQIANSQAEEHGDFVHGHYEATVRRNPDRIQVLQKRTGFAYGVSVTISKGITLNAGSSDLEIAYMIEGLPTDFHGHFGVEFNFSGIPDGQDDRFVLASDTSNLGQVGQMLDLHQQSKVELVDGWLDIAAGLQFEQETSVWTFPIQSVSQSEAGFELVHQSVVVQPHWEVRPDASGRWVAKMVLTTRSASGDNRNGQELVAAAAR